MSEFTSVYKDAGSVSYGRCFFSLGFVATAASNILTEH